ncbi:MAG: class I SAM-dependent DNA methyltransferase [Oceanipulchritudo sp.]
MEELDDFIGRWKSSGASERANCQPFLMELCAVLNLPRPEPAKPDHKENAYVFERAVPFTMPDGTTSTGRIDLYKRGCFVLEAKQGAEEGAVRTGHGTRGSGHWDQAMVRAKRQAEDYVHCLPVEEGRPPFILVVDVGHSIEIYSEFSRTGGTYVAFPDPRSHRILLDDLKKPEVRERLRALWTDPLSLDPSSRASRVTKEIAAQLAKLAQSMEASGNPPSSVAGFLMRCIFTMFAEDIGLLPKDRFRELLETFRGSDLRGFVPVLQEVWRTMDTGGFSVGLRETVLQFNGGLFEDHHVLAITPEQLELLIGAAKADWREVEPAIFGTLLERSLDPKERHQLGAHFTPRSYVERLVVPTVIEPLRREWDATQAAASALIEEGKEKQAVKEIMAFHRRLCHIRVLDPACGSGNFLYVSLEHLKRLEGEIIDTLTRMGEKQEGLELSGETVHPTQLLGIELNPRARILAELCLWIGYLQWHFRTRGNVDPPEPVIAKFHTIAEADAILAYDKEELRKDKDGKMVMQWDGHTFKSHPTTGEQVPDESAQIPVCDYINPRPAEWPETDFVVGNPPFIGPGKMRQALGDGYTEALRKTIPQVPESADLVMYWWDKAAALARQGKIRQFGFITTNSLRQTFARRVLERHLQGDPPLCLKFAIPDHPWVDSADGAAVRIAMTVAKAGRENGTLATVTNEQETGEGFSIVEVQNRTGLLNPNLTIGVDVAKAKSLEANLNLSSRGHELGSAGFLLTPAEAGKLGLGTNPDLERIVRPYRNGRDLTSKPRGVFVIDPHGLWKDELQERFPTLYQWLHDRVLPDRSQNRDKRLREFWWLHRRSREDWRTMLHGLPRYIATVETAKHRIFQFLDACILPDNMVVCIASQQAFDLGVLSSKHHVEWTLAQGGILGPTPRYNKTRCFETFPFPDATDAQKERIGSLAERLDAHRKRQLDAHPHLTLTGIYNVLEQVRAGEELSAKDRKVYEDGLVGILKELHDGLDTAVAEAYGWPPDLEKEEILARLLELNQQRAAEEAAGNIRWLRPEYQAKGAEAFQGEMEGMETKTASAVPAREKVPWPKDLPEQAAVVRQVARDTGWTRQMPIKALSAHFTGARKARLQTVVDALTALGQIQ